MKKIFFVHDDQSDHDTRAKALELAGFEVVLEQDARRCLALIQKERPDLIVSDILIHNMTGFDFALKVREAYPKNKLPMVLCSGIYRGSIYREEARRIGMQDYLVHPTSPSEFVERIRKVFEASGSSDTKAA